MLSLLRRRGESILIGPDTRVTLLDVQDGRAYLAVAHPIGTPEVCCDRCKGEGVEIGPGVRVAILSFFGRRARLGIEAPRDVTIQREENLPADWRPGDPLPPSKRRVDDGAAA